MTTRLSLLPLALGLALLTEPLLIAQQDRLVPAPDRRAGEGRGPFPSLTITNVIVIDGTGAPPAGPMNVVIERNRIARITSAGTPNVPLLPAGQAPIGEMIDGTGMYLMPGFVNHSETARSGRASPPRASRSRDPSRDPWPSAARCRGCG
jgi:hypothetical protein